MVRVHDVRIVDLGIKANHCLGDFAGNGEAVLKIIQPLHFIFNLLPPYMGLHGFALDPEDEPDEVVKESLNLHVGFFMGHRSR